MWQGSPINCMLHLLKSWVRSWRWGISKCKAAQVKTSDVGGLMQRRQMQRCMVFAAGVSNVTAALMVAMSLYHQLPGPQLLQEHMTFCFFSLALGFWLVSTCACLSFTYRPQTATPQVMNIFFVSFMISLILPIILEPAAVESCTVQGVMGPARILLHIFGTVPITFITNMGFSLTYCVALSVHSYQMELPVVAEILQLVFVLLATYIASSVPAQDHFESKSNSSRSEIESLIRILKASCDGVVHLNSNLEIQDDSITFGSLFGNESLSGQLFSDMLVNQDRAGFLDSISRDANRLAVNSQEHRQSIAVALNVQLQKKNRRPCGAQLFCSSFIHTDQRVHHHIVVMAKDNGCDHHPELEDSEDEELRVGNSCHQEAEQCCAEADCDDSVAQVAAWIDVFSDTYEIQMCTKSFVDLFMPACKTPKMGMSQLMDSRELMDFTKWVQQIYNHISLFDKENAAEHQAILRFQPQHLRMFKVCVEATVSVDVAGSIERDLDMDKDGQTIKEQSEDSEEQETYILALVFDEVALVQDDKYKEALPDDSETKVQSSDFTCWSDSKKTSRSL